MSTSCFPIAPGLPPNYNIPPDWLSSPLSPPPFDGSPDDPRWVGSFTHSFGDGAGVQVLFRGLTDLGNTKLLLSWLVEVDPQVTAGVDSLFVGFGSSTAAVLVRIQIETASLTTFGTAAGGAYAADTFVYSGMSWSGSNPAPAWITNGTRVWVNYNRPGSPNPTPWAVQMVVPIGQFIDPNNNTVKIQSATGFKMWYSALVNTPAETGAVIQYQWPNTPGLGASSYPAPSTWPDARISNTANDPACPPQTGISIGVLGIGTKNIDGTPRPDSSEIRFDQTGNDATQPNHSNIFFAHPDFPLGTLDSRKSQVWARFRIANWGSQIGTLTPLSWQNIPGGDNVQCNTAINGGECQFPWPTQPDMSQADTQALLALFRSGTTTRDQCMLVDLWSTFLGETFLNNSIRRNMDLVGASKFSREAEISIVGLTPIGIIPRDVYLYLETINMPTKVDQEHEMRRKRYGETFRSALLRGGEQQEGRMPTVDEIAQYLPTYRVHVYHDTGVRTTLLGGSRPILRPQSSFGYFVEHEGNLIGWAARLHGAIRIAENFYLIRVPEGGSAKVNTVIQAVENPGEAVDPEDPIVPIPPKPMPEPVGCLLAIINAIKKLLGMS